MNTIGSKHSGIYFIIPWLILISFACSNAPAVTNTPIPADSPAPTTTFTPIPTRTSQPTPTLTATQAVTATANQCATLPEGLVGWWPGNGSTQDVVAGNDGLLNGGTIFETGKVKQAFGFNGIDSSVDIPQRVNLNASRQVSVEFWMKPARGNTMDSCCQGLVGTDYYLMELSGGRTSNIGVNFVINTGSRFIHTSDKTNTGFKVPPDQWSFVVGTYDGKSLRLYINGNEEVHQNQQGNIIPMLSESFLSIGSEDGRTNCSNCPGTRYFKGLIDEVSIYNRALTEAEIQSIYSAGEAGKCNLQK
jgi:hypothetical protein